MAFGAQAGVVAGRWAAVDFNEENPSDPMTSDQPISGRLARR